MRRTTKKRFASPSWAMLFFFLLNKKSFLLFRCRRDLSLQKKLKNSFEIWIFAWNIKMHKQGTGLPDAFSTSDTLEELRVYAECIRNAKMLLSLFSHQFLELVLRVMNRWEKGAWNKNQTDTKNAFCFRDIWYQSKTPISYL